MNSPEHFDQLLRQALAPTVEPGQELNAKIINQLTDSESLKKHFVNKSVFKKRIASIPVAAGLILFMTISVVAAIHFLSPKQVAEHLGDRTLAQAFSGKNAIVVNKSVDSGGYHFTLQGIVSGQDLSDFKSSAEDINPDRTYAVVSIAKLDGSKMPDTRDAEYGQTPFFISPLIKGEKPWQINIASMNGGYSECVIDGVMYRLIECDGVEMFADRVLYLCISTSSFYDIKAFNYNEATGEISINSNYKGANALFDLPLDKSKADHDKAEKYLEELKKPAADSKADKRPSQDWEKELAQGTIIPESIKEVTYDENGLACYKYEGYNISVAVDSLFEPGQTGVSKMAYISEDGSSKTAVQFLRDEKGVITGRIIKLN
ncbi:MAG: hypothetical protein ABFD66_05600 [Smithella sp.]